MPNQKKQWVKNFRLLFIILAHIVAWPSIVGWHLSVENEGDEVIPSFFLTGMFINIPWLVFLMYLLVRILP